MFSLIIYFCAFISTAGLLHRLYKNKFDVTTFLIFAFSLQGFLIATYWSASDVNIFVTGNAESFGQFGDYIGGIINPIFGFITVIILLVSMHKNDKNEEEDRKNLAESNRLKTLDRLTYSIKKTKKSLTQSIKNNPLLFRHDGKHISYDDFCKLNDSTLENQFEIMTLGSQILSDYVHKKIEIENHPDIKKYAYHKKNLVTASNLKLKLEYVILLYIEKIKLENSPLLKKALSIELTDLLIKMSTFYLITTEEFKNTTLLTQEITA